LRLQGIAAVTVHISPPFRWRPVAHDAIYGQSLVNLTAMNDSALAQMLQLMLLLPTHCIEKHHRQPGSNPSTLLLMIFDVWMAQFNALPSVFSRHPPQASIGVA